MHYDIGNNEDAGDLNAANAAGYAESQAEDTVHGLTFEEWLKKVDANLESRIGLGHEDLEDFCSYDAWNDEMSPKEGADACLENDGIYSEPFLNGEI